MIATLRRDVPLRLSDDAVATAVARTEGVTASFLEELLRRAVLEALVERDPDVEVTAAQVHRALDGLLDSARQATRTLLGVGAEEVLRDDDGGWSGPASAIEYTGSYRPYDGG